MKKNPTNSENTNKLNKRNAKGINLDILRIITKFTILYINSKDLTQLSHKATKIIKNLWQNSQMVFFNLKLLLYL